MYVIAEVYFDMYVLAEVYFSMCVIAEVYSNIYVIAELGLYFNMYVIVFWESTRLCKLQAYSQIN